MDHVDGPLISGAISISVKGGPETCRETPAAGEILHSAVVPVSAMASNLIIASVILVASFCFVFSKLGL